MKSILWTVCVLTFSSIVFADVYIDLYDADTMVELGSYDVMEGMDLVIVVGSDANEPWYGGVFIEGNDRGEGEISARNSDPNVISWDLSVLESAGTDADVVTYRDYSVRGFDMYTGDGVTSGDWFIFDYAVTKKGLCDINIYNYDGLVADSFDTPDPNTSVQVTQTKTRDLNDDGCVNILDYSIFSSYWLDPNCISDSDCICADFDDSEVVDVNDLEMFTEYWLWSDSNFSEPNVPEYTEPVDPNATFAIVDANDLDEITINVDQSVRLYVDYSAVDPNTFELVGFEFEVNISDPNLGYIDNTVIDSTDPNQLPTAEILITSPMLKYYGPGDIQSEGIHMTAVRFGDIDEGHLASFVYTAEQEGDVTLEIINKTSPYPVLQDILIHQIE